MTLLIREREVQQLLTMERALALVAEAFQQLGQGEAINQPRVRTRVPGGMLHLMVAALPSAGAMGYKAYTSTPSGTKFKVMLYSIESGELTAIVEANLLGQVRTGAASGVASRYMAREESATVGIIGSGFQARAQLAAVCAVRPIRRALVYSPNAEHRQAFAQEMSRSLGIEVRPAPAAQEAVRPADILITMTTARDPVFQGEWLQPGTHINAAGSNFAVRRELDETAVRRSARIVVDSREQAKLECGDLLPLMERGELSWEGVVELGEVVAGKAVGRGSSQEITLFESQGLALEDIAVSAWVYEQAQAQGLGTELPI